MSRNRKIAGKYQRIGKVAEKNIREYGKLLKKIREKVKLLLLMRRMILLECVKIQYCVVPMLGGWVGGR